MSCCLHIEDAMPSRVLIAPVKRAFLFHWASLCRKRPCLRTGEMVVHSPVSG